MTVNLSRSLFARQRDEQKLVASRDAMLDGEAVVAVEQCMRGQHSSDKQFVSTEFMEALRDAAFALGVDFGSVVQPHYGALADYERCVYSWRWSVDHWAMLMFDGKQRAMLVMFGVPLIDKLVGSFAYRECAERNALCLINVGPYAEMLVKPVADSSNVQLIVPELRVEVELQNETPQRLCREPAPMAPK